MIFKGRLLNLGYLTNTGIGQLYGLSVTYSFIVVTIALPKMGILVGVIPLYISMILLAIVSLEGLLGRHASSVGASKLSYCLLLIVGSILWLLGWGTVFSQYPGSTFYYARHAFNFFPIFGLGAYFFVINRINFEQLCRLIRISYYFTLIYALAQFALGPEAVAINHITSTYSDGFDDVLRKSNTIHSLERSKLFSTYQNGNLYVISLILLFPFAYLSENKKWIRHASVMSTALVVVFCGSASGYFGFVSLLSFMTITRRSITVKFILKVLIAIAMIIIISLLFFNSNTGIADMINARLIDREFGNDPRIERISHWISRLNEDPSLLLTGSFYHTKKMMIFETLPLSIIQYYGILFFILFLFFIINSSLFLLPNAYKAGLYSYSLMCFGEGGFWLMPTSGILAIALAGCYLSSTSNLASVKRQI